MSLSTPPQLASSSGQLPESRRAPVGAVALVVAGGGVAALFVFGPGLLSIMAIVLGLLVFAGAALVRKSLQATGSLMGDTERIKLLKRQIMKSKYLENVGDLGERVADQMELSSERFEKLKALLGLKFEPSELTYGRYLSVAEAAFLSVFDNLHAAAISLNALDVKDTSADSERLVLRQQQLTKVKQLLELNERAITELERVSAALAEVKTRRGEGSHSLDALMAELAELAKRAKLYSVETLHSDDTGEKK